MDSDQSRGLLSNDLVGGLLVSVGDKSTERLIELDIQPALQVIDGVERRVRRNRIAFGGSKDDIIYANNPAGTITRDALTALSKALKILKGQKERIIRIEIDGEEDLLVLPVLAFFPEGTIVVYGQPGEGLVIVWASEKSREFSKKILSEIGVDGLN